MPLSWLSKDRPCKAICRNLAVKKYKLPKGQAALFLPGESCLDLKLALSNGLVTLKTPLILVERDLETSKKILQRIWGLGFKTYYLHRGPIHTLDLGLVLKRFGPKVKLGYMFADLCGEMTENVCGWLKKLDKNVVGQNGKLLFTFQFFRKSLEWREKIRGHLNGLHHTIDLDLKYMPAIKKRFNRFDPTDEFSTEPAKEFLNKKIWQDFSLIGRMTEFYLRSLNAKVTNAIAYYDLRNWMFFLESSLNNK